jgi:hypothetical protein
MKRNLVFGFTALLCLSSALSLQSQTIETQACYGGTGGDQGWWGQILPDDARIFGGMTNSNNGQVSGNHGGGVDAWAVKTDAAGSILFQRCIGGTDFEFGAAGVPTPEGGIVVVGQSLSNDGDFAGQLKGSSDAFVAKIGPSGNLVWAKLLGGSQGDIFEDVWPVASGGYIAAGETASNDGDITDYHGGQGDMWVVRFDENGNVLWKKTFGGTGLDGCRGIWKTNDGNFIVVGFTNSTDGPIPAAFGSRDVVLMKINPNGNVIWSNSYGGPNLEMGFSVRQKPNGEFVALASTSGNGGQVSGFHGVNDFWAFRTDANGNFLGQRALGGSQGDTPRRLEILPDGGLLVTGGTSSTDGDVANPSAAKDGWVARLSPTLDLLWSKVTVTGIESPISYATLLPSGNVFAVSSSGAVTGDVICAKGGGDVWLLEIAPPAVRTTEAEGARAFSLASNPSPDAFRVLAEGPSFESLELLVFNTLGRQMLATSGSLAELNTTLARTAHWQAGCYFLQIRQGQSAQTLKAVKQ